MSTMIQIHVSSETVGQLPDVAGTHSPLRLTVSSRGSEVKEEDGE